MPLPSMLTNSLGIGHGGKVPGVLEVKVVDAVSAIGKGEREMAHRAMLLNLPSISSNC